MLMNNPLLKSKIDQLWDKFWSGGISNPLTAIEQITYLLFMKRLDDLDANNQANAEFAGVPYTSKFEGWWIPPEHVFRLDESEEEGKSLTALIKEERRKEEREKPFRVNKQELRWSNFKRRQAEDMLSFVQTRVFPFLKELNGETSPFTKHMKNAVFIIPKPSLLYEAITTIDEIFEIMEKDSRDGGQYFQDIQGDVYEMLLNEIAQAGKNGQFRTPRHIIKLIAELVAPEPGTRNKIADPACGTGGFLLGAYQYMVTQLNKEKDGIQPDEDGFIRTSATTHLTENIKNILGDSLYGFDIDITMVRLGLMNLMMHGVEAPQIDYKDTLSKSYDEEGVYQYIMANPPFTGSIDRGDMSKSFTLSTTKTELLFLERIYNMLRIGGTAGVIVPQGVLFGSGNAFVETRKILVEKCELKAVITMPSGVFKPYAGVSTAILIFTKVAEGAETKNVWFYEMQDDGYTLDDKRTKKEGYGELQDIVVQYKNRDASKENDRKGKFFFVPKSEIVKEKYDLSLSKYKETVIPEVVYRKPGVILAELRSMESDINKELKELEDMLG